MAPQVFRVPDLRWPVASPDLRPPRGLPARSPSALRALLGASARSPARPCRPRGGLQSGGACRCEWPGLARPPARLGCLTAFGSAPRSPPVPSGPSGALHTSGARSLFGGSVRRLIVRPGPPPTGTAARPSGPSGALRTSGPGALMCGWRVALMSSYGCRSATSHVIPRRLIQTLNLHRWNCNVFGVYRKITAINYVRDFAGGGVAATSGPRSQARWFSQHPSRRRRWGFCTTRSPQGARRRRVGPSCSAIPPPFEGGKAATRGGVVAKPQARRV